MRRNGLSVRMMSEFEINLCRFGEFVDEQFPSDIEREDLCEQHVFILTVRFDAMRE